MTQYFPIVIEAEENGTYSAWVAGVPGVYSSADTAPAAKRAIVGALSAHVRAMRELGYEPHSTATVAVIRRDTFTTQPDEFRMVGVAALLANKTSRAKAASSRRNGRKGGRPRTRR